MLIPHSYMTICTSGTLLFNYLFLDISTIDENFHLGRILKAKSINTSRENIKLM
jgi:hypothetical protein